MRAISDFAYGALNGVENYRVGGHESAKIGRIRVIDTGARTLVTSTQFPEVTLSVRGATVVCPNVVVADPETLIDVGNGYLATELIDLHPTTYGVRRAGQEWDVRFPPNTFEIDECAYLQAPANYSAFLLGELPRVEAYEPYLAAGVPLVTHGQILPFQRQLFAMVGVDPNEVIVLPEDTMVRAGRLIHATPTYLHNTTSFRALDFLRKRLTPASGALGDGEPVYLSRSRLGPKSDRRITNELELEAFLRSRGFRIVHPQELSPLDQIDIFATASTLISPFGATWASSVFRRPGGRSLMLATKWTPDFAQIFQYLGEDLSLLRLTEDRRPDDGSPTFTVTDKTLELISSFLDGT